MCDHALDEISVCRSESAFSNAATTSTIVSSDSEEPFRIASTRPLTVSMLDCRVVSAVVRAVASSTTACALTASAAVARATSASIADCRSESASARALDSAASAARARVSSAEMSDARPASADVAREI